MTIFVQLKHSIFSNVRPSWIASNACLTHILKLLIVLQLLFKF